MSFSSSQEERFSAILQPIRDLARNWDIDIAHHLEEYLEDLEKIEISFDDGSTTMNFSEAALLIQGSAGVYAKKVEYLHSLVLQVLDLITQKKKQKKGGEGDAGDGDNDDNGADEEFLPLDDIEETESSYMKEVETSLNKSIHPIPQMPPTLIPLEECQKGDHPICNHKGEVVGNYFDFLINTGRINSASGINLEAHDAEILNMQQNDLRELVNVELDGSRFDEAPPLMDDNDCDDIFPMEDGGNEELPEDPVCANGTDKDESNSENVQQNQKRYAESRPRKKRVTFLRPESRPGNDIWAIIDPHEKGKSMEKTYKKKKTYKIPVDLDDTSTKKRKIKTEIKKELAPIYEVAAKAFSNKPYFPKSSVKIPDYPEVEDVFWKEYKVREKIKKEEIKMLKMEEQMEEMNLADDEPAAMEAPRDDFDEMADCDDDNMPVLQLDQQDFGNDLDHRRRTLGHNIGDFQSHIGNDITISYEELVRQHVDKFLASASEYAQLTDLSRKVTEWEEKIKPRLEEEEQHAPFDIHEYGTKVIEDLVRGEWKFFMDIMRGKPQYEVCRFTLATLQLANVYNVELKVTPDETGNIVDRLQVKLLSKKRHFEELEDFLAPSVKDT